MWSHQLALKLQLDLGQYRVERLSQEGHVGHLRTLVVVRRVIENEGRRYPEEAADLPDTELSGVQELKVYRTHADRGELDLTREADNLLAPPELGVQVVGGLLELVVRVLTEPPRGVVVADDPADVAAVGEAVEGLVIAGSLHVECEARE